MAAGFKTAQVNASMVPSTQSSFPTYVDLSRLGITTLAEAQSVRVYADSGKTTEWAREIVSATEMHVKIPSFTSTTAIYVDWDGVRADYAVTDTYGRNAVWSDYVAVWHFDETSGTRYDSTANGNNLSVTGTVASVTGAFGSGKGASILGGANYLSITDAAQTGLDVDATDKITVSAWVQPRAYASMAIANKYNHPSGQAYSNVINFNSSVSTSVNFYLSATGTSAVATPGVTVTASPTNSWYHFVSVLDAPSSGDDLYVYRNGSLAGSAEDVQAITQIYNTTQAFIVGRRTDGAWQINAYIDELKIRNDAVLDANWNETEYNNQSDEAGFWGTWTDAGGGGGYVFVPQIRPFVGL